MLTEKSNPNKNDILLNKTKHIYITVHTFQPPFLNEEHTSTCVSTNEMRPIEALSLRVHRDLGLNID